MAKHGVNTREIRQRGKGRPFEKGNPGRPGGARSKITVALVDDVIAAYEKKGGVEWLYGLNDQIFARLLERLVPAHSIHEQATPITCVFPDRPGREAAKETAKMVDDMLHVPEDELGRTTPVEAV